MIHHCIHWLFDFRASRSSLMSYDIFCDLLVVDWQAVSQSEYRLLNDTPGGIPCASTVTIQLWLILHDVRGCRLSWFWHRRHRPCRLHCSVIVSRAGIDQTINQCNHQTAAAASARRCSRCCVIFLNALFSDTHARLLHWTRNDTSSWTSIPGHHASSGSYCINMKKVLTDWLLPLCINIHV